MTLHVDGGQRVLDADGVALDGPVAPGTGFYLRRIPGASAITLTASTPHNLGGRVLTGAVLDGPAQRFTPVATTVPTTREFDIRWDDTRPFSQADI